jgi:hypothetical protein
MLARTTRGAVPLVARTVRHGLSLANVHFGGQLVYDGDVVASVLVDQRRF